MADESHTQSDAVPSRAITVEGGSETESTPAISAARQKQLSTVTTLLLGNELLERLAFYGMSSNLITFLTTKMHQDPTTAAAQVNNFTGATYLTPLLGAYIADTWLGRYHTIMYLSLVYLLGFVVVSLCPTLPALQPAAGAPATTFQFAVFDMGLYLTALGGGGIKPCVSTFGADQYHEDVPAEAAMLSSFFNWFYISINIGSFFASSVVVYLQQEVSWVWGMWVNAAAFAVALLLLLAGHRLYRFKKPTGSPMTQLAQVLCSAWVKRKLALPATPADLYEDDARKLVGDKPEAGEMLMHTDRMRWLDKGAVRCNAYSTRWLVTVHQVEEIKKVLWLLPYFLLTIVYSIVYNQLNSLFILQGNTLDGNVFGVVIPAASLSLFNTIAVILSTIVYDSYVKPAFEAWGRPISIGQQIGAGFLLTSASMCVAALVDVWRLRLIAEHGLEHVDPAVTSVPLSVLWQVPVYFLLGVAEILGYVGCLDLFYRAAPPSMRALTTALLLFSSSVGAYASTGLLLLVELVTDHDGSGGWIAHNLNTARLDLFFWLLALMQFADYLALVLMLRTPSTDPLPVQPVAAPDSRASSEHGELAAAVRCHASFTSAASRSLSAPADANTLTTPLLQETAV